MDYGTPKLPNTGIAAAAGLAAVSQVFLLIAIVLLVIAGAVCIRYGWRKNKKLNER